MKAAQISARGPKTSSAEIVAHVRGNICYCGAYNRTIAEIQRVSKEG